MSKKILSISAKKNGTSSISRCQVETLTSVRAPGLNSLKSHPYPIKEVI